MENWGYGWLAKYTRKESIEEMQHAEKILERMLYLDGSPNMSELFPLRIGQSIKDQLANDLALECEAVPRLNKAVNCAVEAGDNGSRDLFESIETQKKLDAENKKRLHRVSEEYKETAYREQRSLRRKEGQA